MASGSVAGAALGQLKRQTLRDQIVEALRRSIMTGELEPGAQITESEMARTFGVSRGPLREALGQLIQDGLVVAVPYTGTHVVELTLQEVQEIFSLRTELEIFAFRQIWDQRDATYIAELNRRHDKLLESIAANDDESSIQDELALHSHVYEACGHSMLLGVWQGLKGKLQLYWAAHHRAHGRRGPRAQGHASYVALAQGDDLDAMIAEIRRHMVQGFSRTETFLLDRQKTKETQSK